MAKVIHPDGSVTAFAYTGIESAHQQLGGYFDSVPQQIPTGHLVLVHDEGRLNALPRNAHAERLTGYPEIYGPAVVVSFEEAKEDELLERISPAARSEFQTRLAAIEARPR